MKEENVKREEKWYRLDNAATIIPSSIKGADTRVFRIVCELNDCWRTDFTVLIKCNKLFSHEPHRDAFPTSLI